MGVIVLAVPADMSCGEIVAPDKSKENLNIFEVKDVSEARNIAFILRSVEVKVEVVTAVAYTVSIICAFGNHHLCVRSGIFSILLMWVPQYRFEFSLN